MSSRKTAGRKAGYVRRRAGSTREKGRRALSLILAVLMVMASCLDAIPARAAGTEAATEGTELIGVGEGDEGVRYEVIDSAQKTLRIIGLATPHATTIDYIDYVTNEGKVTINGEEYTVTEVADRAFANSNLTYVYFPKTITSYGNGILDNCSKLTHVQNNSSVKLKLPEFEETDTSAWYNQGLSICAESLPVTDEKGATDYDAEKTPNMAWVIYFDVNADDAHFSDGTTEKIKRILYKNKITNLDEVPVREGYVFKGWSKAIRNGKVAYDFDKADVADSKFNAHNTGQFYAIWQENGSSTAPVNISNCNVTLDRTSYDYIKGTQIKPEVTVTYNGTKLTETTDYTVSYGANNVAGDDKGSVTVIGAGSGYTGSKTVYFTINKITAPNPPATTMEVENEIKTVSQIKLSDGWSWSDGNIELPEGKTIQATAVYGDTDNYTNTSVTVSITRKKTFTSLTGITLEPSALSLEIGESKELTVSQEPKEASLGTVTWSLSKDGVVTLTGSGNTVTIKAVAAGTTTIKATSGGFSAECKVTVTAPNLSASGDLAFSTLEYGYSSPTKTVTISNNGNAAASEIKASLSAGTGSGFTISAAPSGTLEVNGQTTVSVLPKPGLNVGNYSDTLVISYKGGTDIKIPVSFTVKEQTVTVKADDKEITYGDNLPTDFHYQITPAEITGLKVSCAVKNVPQIPETGTYTIEVSVENDNSNYKIDCQNGTLTVKQKTVSDAEIVFPVAGNITMGQQLKESVLSGGSTQYGTFAWENETETLSATGSNKKNVVLTLNETSKKNCSFTGVTGYDSTKGTITREVDIYVGRANMPSIEFPSGLTAVYGKSLEDVSLPESEYGEFKWKLPDTELDQVGEREYAVVFEWSEDVKSQYGLNENELKIEKNITIMIEKADNLEVPETPDLLSRTSSGISLQGQKGVEYSLDQIRWTSAGNGEFQNLSPFTAYTIYARYAATETHKESQPRETLVLYTLVANPYEIDLSKIGDANYREALYTEYNTNKKHLTISYDDSSKELTLLDSVDVYGNGYILTGNAADVTVKTGNSGRYNITMENAAMKKLELSGAETDLELPGNSTSTVSEGIHARNNLTVSGPGKLTASEIEVSNGNLSLQNLTAEIGPSAAGKAALSAEEVAITDGSKVTATGGAEAPAIEANGSITLKDSKIQAETDGTPETPAISTDTGSIVVENTEVNSESCKNNLYSQTPKNEKGEIIHYYTVTLQYCDGEKAKATIKEGDSYTLPSPDEEHGYRMAWQDESKHRYQPGATVTVNGDMTFTQVAEPIKVTRITLDSTAETIEVGDGVTLAETVMPEDALNDAVSWSSSNSKVATVNQDGDVSGIAPGKAVITVTAKDGSGVSARCTITVVPGEIEVTKVKITGDTKKVAPGKKLKLKATVSPSNATDQSVKWKVSNSKYASVNSKGVVTTKKAGAGKNVTVTAVSNSSGEEATYKISIMKKAVKKIKLTASKKTLKKKKSVTIKAKFTPSSGISKELTWTSSNKKVATVNSKGKVTAKKKGKAKITAKAKDGSGKKATITIKVK